MKYDVVYLYTEFFEFKEGTDDIQEDLNGQPEEGIVYRAIRRKAMTPSGYLYHIDLVDSYDNEDTDIYGITVTKLKGETSQYNFSFKKMTLDEIIEDDDMDIDNVSRVSRWEAKENTDLIAMFEAEVMKSNNKRNKDEEEAAMKEVLKLHEEIEADDDAKQAVDDFLEAIKNGAVSIQKIEGDYDGFVKDKKNKAPLSMLPGDALKEIASVFEYGAAKYERDNWKKCNDESVYLDAALRHVYSHLDGNHIDDESKKLHLAHAATDCIMALYVLIKNKD